MLNPARHRRYPGTKLQLLLFFTLIGLIIGAAIGFYTALGSTPKDDTSDPKHHTHQLTSREKHGSLIGGSIGGLTPFILLLFYELYQYITFKLEARREREESKELEYDDVEVSDSSSEDELNTITIR